MALTKLDRDLLERCLAGKPGAWRDFVDRFLRLFVHVIRHTAHARSVKLVQADIDDLCAEIFLEILADDFRVLRQFRGKSSLATYLAVISRRVTVKEIAHRRKEKSLGLTDLTQSSAAANGEQQRIEDADEVRQLLTLLSPDDAKIVKQYHLHGKSYREISDLLGVPENSIGPTLTRAREKLRTASGKVSS